MALKVKLLNPKAKLPTVAHPGSDLGYDLYAIEDQLLIPLQVAEVHLGIAVEMEPPGFGFLIRDRSSLARKGLMISGGVIDAGYRGELVVLMTLLGNILEGRYLIKQGDKVAQLIPMLPKTHNAIISVDELTSTERGAAGFGSTGR